MEKIISGKVREVYAVSEKELAIVATDRISAFDVILEPAIQGKGIALNLISNFWFDLTRKIVPNHLIETDFAKLPPPFSADPARYKNRTVLVKKLKMLPYEFVVRGYLFGSLWKEYQAAGTFCGEPAQAGFALAEKLPQPIVTPAAKRSKGHDENIPYGQLEAELGIAEAGKIRGICLALYKACAGYALSKGVIIADSKFEFGYDEAGTLTLGDELFTPDSSRFWAAESYRAGVSPKSYDKQSVRDWLIARRLAGALPGAALPVEIVRQTEALYRSCCEKITGEAFPS